MERTTTCIIGAGQSGLAMSLEMTKRSIDHVVLERGHIANSWRKERWDSLALLTPNWANTLPGIGYPGNAPDGFMRVKELLSNFDLSASAIGAPVRTETTVLAIDTHGEDYRVQTDQGIVAAEYVVFANGACAVPKVPEFASSLPRAVRQFTPHNYKRPTDLPEQPVLVVGASATGLQLAREVQLSGRQVILAVGNHLRLPRTYRSIDTVRWLEAIGATTIPYTDVDDIERVRRTPSLSLVAHETLDLNILQDIGVEITGRLAAVRDGTAYFSGGLASMCQAGDLKMNRLLLSIDDWIERHGQGSDLPPAYRHPETRVPGSPRLKIDVTAERIGAVIWATGYSPDFSWLKLPVFDRKGRLKHDGGIVGAGLFAMGLPYMRQRKSTFLNGASDDAAALAARLSYRLDHRSAA